MSIRARLFPCVGALFGGLALSAPVESPASDEIPFPPSTCCIIDCDDDNEDAESVSISVGNQSGGVTVVADITFVGKDDAICQTIKVALSNAGIAAKRYGTSVVTPNRWCNSLEVLDGDDQPVLLYPSIDYLNVQDPVVLIDVDPTSPDTEERVNESESTGGVYQFRIGNIALNCAIPANSIDDDAATAIENCLLGKNFDVEVISHTTMVVYTRSLPKALGNIPLDLEKHLQFLAKVSGPALQGPGVGLLLLLLSITGAVTLRRRRTRR